jgi:hypothetical protein
LLTATRQRRLLLSDLDRGLHQLVGNDPAKAIEILGTIREVVCMTARSEKLRAAT